VAGALDEPSRLLPRSEGLDCGPAAYLAAAHALYGVHHLVALLPAVAGARSASPGSICSTSPSRNSPSRRAAAALVRPGSKLQLLAELGLASILRPAPPPARPAIWSMCRPRAVGRWSPRGRRAVAGAASGAAAFLCENRHRCAVRAASLREGFALHRLLPRPPCLEPRGETLPPARQAIHRRGGADRYLPRVKAMSPRGSASSPFRPASARQMVAVSGMMPLRLSR